MSVVLNHKSLGFEQLYLVSCEKNPAHLKIDDITLSSLENSHGQNACTNKITNAADLDEQLRKLHYLKPAHLRGILLYKLEQILKMKSKSSIATIHLLVQVINANEIFNVSDEVGLFSKLQKAAEIVSITFNDHELSIFAHVDHFVPYCAIELYKLSSQNQSQVTILALMLELCGVSKSQVSEETLKQGKSNQTANNFSANMLALIDSSKLIIEKSNHLTQQTSELLQLWRMFFLQVTYIAKVSQLCAMLAHCLNRNSTKLFETKGSQDLRLIETSQITHEGQCIANEINPLMLLSHEIGELNEVFSKHICLEPIQQQKTEESKGQHQNVFEWLGSNQLFKSCIKGLAAAFEKIQYQEAQIMFAIDEVKPQQIKRKKTQKSISLLIGKGTQKFVEFLKTHTDKTQSEDDLMGLLSPLSNPDLRILLSEIFAPKNDNRRKPKVAKGTRDMDPHQMVIKEKAINLIKGEFKKHGAVEIDTPVFELKETLMGKYGEDSKLIYDLEDQGGEILSLRYDLTVPFARYVAMNNIKQIKRFHIAKVYRRDNPQMNKGRFREFYQCDFDIAGEYDTMIADAEVLKVLSGILNGLDIGNFVLKVNNRKFLDAIIEICGCEKRKFKAICSSVDKLDKEPWEKVKEELITVKGLTEEMTNNLAKYVKLVGKPKEMIQRLKDEKLFEGHKGGEETIKEMEILFDYLEDLQCISHISFDFSLARGLDYYTGLIFEAVLSDGQSVGSIAGGGRYDELVGMFAGKTIPAVGGSIGIERIFSILEEKAKREGVMRKNLTQVLVAQAGKGQHLLRERLKVLADLWAKGFKCETFYKVNPKPIKQTEFALESGIPLILWIGENELQQGVVKIKSLNKKEDYTLTREELAAGDRLTSIIEDGNMVLYSAG